MKLLTAGGIYAPFSFFRSAIAGDRMRILGRYYHTRIHLSSYIPMILVCFYWWVCGGCSQASGFDTPEQKAAPADSLRALEITKDASVWDTTGLVSPWDSCPPTPRQLDSMINHIGILANSVGAQMAELKLALIGEMCPGVDLTSPSAINAEIDRIDSQLGEEQ